MRAINFVRISESVHSQIFLIRNKFLNVKELLAKYGLKPNKLLGQNFLTDRSVLEKIIATANLTKEDVVLEAGPGLGILTQELALRAGRVIAVEKDRKMAEILKEEFKNFNNFEIIQGDILKINHKIETENYKIVSNLPYYLTSHFIRKFLEAANPPQEMVLMIQKEVAQRICAKPPEMSLLAVSVQFYAQPKIISFVSKKSFWPQPKVDSAIIKIVPINKHDSDFRTSFFRLVRAGFAHPRKQLISNLSRGLKIERDQTLLALNKIKIKPEQRAETLSLENWIKLAEIL